MEYLGHGKCSITAKSAGSVSIEKPFTIVLSTCRAFTEYFVPAKDGTAKDGRWRAPNLFLRRAVPADLDKFVNERKDDRCVLVQPAFYPLLERIPGPQRRLVEHGYRRTLLSTRPENNESFSRFSTTASWGCASGLYFRAFSLMKYCHLGCIGLKSQSPRRRPFDEINFFVALNRRQ